MKLLGVLNCMFFFKVLVMRVGLSVHTAQFQRSQRSFTTMYDIRTQSTLSQLVFSGDPSQPVERGMTPDRILMKTLPPASSQQYRQIEYVTAPGS